jgi:hypothetical protein
MTGRISTVSSTKPIISASGTLRIGLALVVAALAAMAAYGAARDLLGERARARAEAALEAAQSLPRGAARDRQLAATQIIAHNGVDLTPDDAGLWNLLAETQLMQATTAAITSISDDLLAAAADASVRAANLAPQDPAASARIALVRSLQVDGKAEVSAALAQSYAARAFDPVLGQRRLEAAGRAWPALNEAVRSETLLEACQLARRGAAERTKLYDLRMGAADPGMALALDRIMADPSCAVRG